MVGHYPDNKIKRIVKKGDVLMLENVVSTFNNQISLTTTFETQMKMISELMTVTLTEHPKSDVVPLTSSCTEVL